MERVARSVTARGCRALFKLRLRSVRRCFRNPMPPTGTKSFAFATPPGKQSPGTRANPCSNFYFFRGQPLNKISASQNLLERYLNIFEPPPARNFLLAALGRSCARNYKGRSTEFGPFFERVVFPQVLKILDRNPIDPCEKSP